MMYLSWVVIDWPNTHCQEEIYKYHYCSNSGIARVAMLPSPLPPPLPLSQKFNFLKKRAIFQVQIETTTLWSVYHVTLLPKTTPIICPHFSCGCYFLYLLNKLISLFPTLNSHQRPPLLHVCGRFRFVEGITVYKGKYCTCTILICKDLHTQGDLSHCPHGVYSRSRWASVYVHIMDLFVYIRLCIAQEPQLQPSIQNMYMQVNMESCIKYLLLL